MTSIRKYVLQALNYALFMVVVWYFSTRPEYHQLEADQAVVTLAFAHAAALREECRVRTQDELDRLPPNMRLPTECPRERSPITLEMFLDDSLIMKRVIKAPGLHQDQGIDVFHRIKVPAGDHRLTVLMNDDIKVSGPTYRYQEDVNLLPEQQLLVNFHAESGGFFLN